MRVLVTRPEADAPPWLEALRARGFDAVSLPLIGISPVPAPAASLHDAWRHLQGARAVMFVSGNAARQFFAQRPVDAHWPDGLRAWATGNGTRDALLQGGIGPGAIDAPPASSPQFDSETLWQQVAAQVRPGDRVLIVRGGDAQGASSGRDWLADRLRAAGASVDAVVAYRRQLPVWNDAQRTQAVAARGSDGVWLFSSSQAVAHLLELLPGQDWSRARAVATHARIAQAARDAGFGVVCESRPTLDAVIAALESIR